MKLRTLLSFAAVAVAFSLPSFAAVETYAMDPAHSSVNFSIRHLFSEVPGHFNKFTGTLTVDRDNMEKSSAEATIDVASVDTANAMRNGHLQKPEFFDAAKFPTITFKSTSWKKTGEDTYDVTGDLTIKGVIKPVVLKVEVLGFGPGLQPGVQVSGWKATTTVHRSDFGVSAFPKVVGEDVAITINAEADLKK
jgi:polyisoprenoid-binding protein YceI